MEIFPSSSSFHILHTFLSEISAHSDLEMVSPPLPCPLWLPQLYPVLPCLSHSGCPPVPSSQRRECASVSAWHSRAFLESWPHPGPPPQAPPSSALTCLPRQHFQLYRGDGAWTLLRKSSPGQNSNYCKCSQCLNAQWRGAGPWAGARGLHICTGRTWANSSGLQRPPGCPRTNSTNLVPVRAASA